ncbi:putative aldouronate transport system permease protein [Paenibacillus castaneae]|uniref:ABC transporter permease n=1 Tax=Paenibacillus castaneae TaxID=474957 RepID=UPI000C9A1E89|nr:ABC transporter permease subunit [Paenibacillus castaneae]NIK80287.1 putative aldouronate transport system permease protein [Paenibacillus castaneae]
MFVNLKRKDRLLRDLPLYFMLLPAVVLVAIFSYGSMAGVIIAFQKFVPAKGLFGDQQWVGFQNFVTLFSVPNIGLVIRNTVIIALFKMIAGVIVPVVFALLLNEVRSMLTKRIFQTVVYLPHFLSWVILSGVLINLLSPSEGIVNIFLSKLGMEQIFFLGDPDVFPATMVVSDIWKAFGFGSVIYLAALTSIDPSLYEAAVIDGANRWRQTWHITLPGISSIIVLMSVLGLANILNGGFDQIYNMYSPVVYSTGDILDTFVFRLGIEQAQYSLSTAAGLFKSGVSLIFIVGSYYLADKFTGYRVF